jgi:hypothetical protein
LALRAVLSGHVNYIKKSNIEKSDGTGYIRRLGPGLQALIPVQTKKVAAMRLVVVIVASLTLFGCVSSSSIYSVGPDIYQISGPTFHKPMLMQEAGEFCMSANMQALVVGTWSETHPATSEITFTCSDGSPRGLAIFNRALDEYERRAALRPSEPSAPAVENSSESFVRPTKRTPWVTLPSLPTSRTTCRKSTSDTLICETDDPYGYARGD